MREWTPPPAPEVSVRIVLFVQSAPSGAVCGWAASQRGIVAELSQRGHDTRVLEICSALDVNAVLDGADACIVPAGSQGPDSTGVVPDLISRIGRHHARTPSYALLLHDTCDRSMSDPASLAALDLRHYDGVLACGEAVARLYVERGWVREAWNWPAASDVRVFRPQKAATARRHETADDGDLVWIGQVGEDPDRQRAFHEFILAPVRRLGLRAAVYGERYAPETLRAMEAAGIEYRGWIPNEHVPQVFSRFAVTIYLPRAPYLRSLPGIATPPLFEALACGIPVVSAGWHDTGGLFTSPPPFMVANTGAEMARCVGTLLADPSAGAHLAALGLHEIHARHTCGHRVEALLHILRAIPTTARSAGARREAAGCLM